MDEFWKWMEENNFPIDDVFHNGELNHQSKLKLIGFMIKYIKNHNYWLFNKEPFPLLIMEIQNALFGKDLYGCFEQIIKKIDK